MYVAFVSSALVAGLVVAGSVLPGADAAGEQQAVTTVTCTQAAHLSSYPPMDAAERHACQRTNTPYAALLANG